MYPSAKIVKDTNTHNGRFGKIVALEDTVLHSFTAQNADGASSTITLNSSCELEIIITQFKLTSGSVIAYRL